MLDFSKPTPVYSGKWCFQPFLFTSDFVFYSAGLGVLLICGEGPNSLMGGFFSCRLGGGTFFRTFVQIL